VFSRGSGPTQNVTLLYSREEVGIASTVDTGIAQQLVAPYTLPKPVPSIHATLGAHVSQTHKNKIINGEYIDLALLPENTTISAKQEKQIVITDGVVESILICNLSCSSYIFHASPRTLVAPKRTVCIYFNNPWYFEGCADEYMLIYTIKASVHFEIEYSTITGHQLINVTTLILKECERNPCNYKQLQACLF
jgi:hypothetical protein